MYINIILKVQANAGMVHTNFFSGLFIIYKMYLKKICVKPRFVLFLAKQRVFDNNIWYKRDQR